MLSRKGEDSTITKAPPRDISGTFHMRRRTLEQRCELVDILSEPKSLSEEKESIYEATYRRWFRKFKDRDRCYAEIRLEVEGYLTLEKTKLIKP
ncbi:hypothetical protein TNCV_3081291 [Trichonephila clavipes]|nr:hypothetical protein TNCV_3081291 [Trichonephila clavipes]